MCDCVSTNLRMAREVTSEETMAALVASPDPVIRVGIASNRNTPPMLLRVLANDSDPRVRLTAVIHPSAPRDIRDSADLPAMLEDAVAGMTEAEAAPVRAAMAKLIR